MRTACTFSSLLHGCYKVCPPRSAAAEEVLAFPEGETEVYSEMSHPRQGVCLVSQCLLAAQACISNVIYYSGDVCPSCPSDEAGLFFQVLLPGVYTQDRLLYLSYKPGWSAACNEAGRAVQMSGDVQKGLKEQRISVCCTEALCIFIQETFPQLWFRAP